MPRRTRRSCPTSSRSTLQDGLYSYDALARLRDANLRQQGQLTAPDDIGRYLRLTLVLMIATAADR